MNTRRTVVEISYNGVAVSTQMLGRDLEVVYTDPASGEADSLDISIHNRSREWLAAWLPFVGDMLSAVIRTEDQGDSSSLQCGAFILDRFDFSGWPLMGMLSAVSVPADGSFRAAERCKNWQDVTIREIGKEIAGRVGIDLVWDVEGSEFRLHNIEQDEQTDCDFYMELCKTYGLAMKVYAGRIVVYDREAYKLKEPVASISEQDMLSWSWAKSLQGTYTGGEYAYTDPRTEEEIKVTVGSGDRVLKISGKADSKADAERKLRAAVDQANHGASRLSVTIMGNAALVAAQCVTVVGLGRLSGKYYIDSVVNRVSGTGGYTMDLELALVEDVTEPVIRDALQRLWAVGVVESPEYWMEHYRDIRYLDELLLNMATCIRANLGGGSINSVAGALDVLVGAGIINRPDYWAAKAGALAWLDALLIKAANALISA